ncbi:MAG: hypothetical protein HY718_10995 [Planctomycetes bacterium]|nr:hypothetical protein [Planctomycetota bacterium]
MKSAGQAQGVEDQVRRFMIAGEEDSAATWPADGAGPVRFVGSKTFYRDGDRWVDSLYDERVAKAAGSSKPETVKVRLFGDEYYDLLGRHSEAGRYLALGTRVVVMLGDKAYETVE